MVLLGSAALIALGIYVIADVAFETGYTFYNAFLPEIASPERIGRVSGYGWGLGYVGGLVCLAVALVGFVPAMGLFVLTFLTLKAGGPLWRNLGLTAVVLVFLTTMSDLLVLDYPRGLLQSAARLPWPLG